MRWLGLLLVVLAACGPSRARRLEERAGAFVFHRSADDVNGALTAYFDERGFDWDPPRPDGVRPTAWKEVYGEWEFATVLERYYVKVKPLGPAHASVQVVRVTQSTTGMETYHPTTGANTGRDTKDVAPSQAMAKGSSPLPFGAPVARRALDVEWELIRRLEPSRAAALENRVDATASR